MITTHRKKARAYKRQLLERIFKSKRRSRSRRWLSIGHYAPEHHNIVGVGFGRKQSNGNQITAPEAVRIYVRKKVPIRNLPRSERIPKEINGLPTDVIQVGTVRFLARPSDCGVSAAHFQAAPGTLGCLVRRVPADGLDYVLSNNHVFANVDTGKAGDPILQPAAQDGGISTDAIARQSWRMALLPNGNIADAATGEVIFQGSVNPTLAGLGRVNPSPMLPVINLSVTKSGRTSYVTVGLISETEADLQVPLRGTTYGFVEQIMVIGSGGPFAVEGDSGSLVVDSHEMRPVGLLFAGSDTVSYVNPIGPILDRLQLEIV